jgi:hypothetical protein
MAKVDIADFGAVKEAHANVESKVGSGERNDKADVLLIQALFHLIGASEPKARKFLGLSGKQDLPDLNGRLDHKTVRAIWKFQRKMAHLLHKADGKIYPGNYSHRLNVSLHQGKQMAITLLNMLAFDESFMLFGVPPLQALKKIAPQLVIKDKPRLAIIK